MPLPSLGAHGFTQLDPDGTGPSPGSGRKTVENASRARTGQAGP